MTESPASDQLFISKLTEIILKNLGNENFGVRELTRLSGISRTSLNRRLRRILNKSINQFIREVRLKKALELLKNGPVTASEVAYKVGFSSPAYFNTCFHEFFGYPPGKLKSEDPEIPEDKILIRESSKHNKKRTGWKPAVFASAAILLLVISGFLIYTTLSGNPIINRNHHNIDPENSIAVLPFKNLGNDTTDQDIYDGVIDEIFNNLRKVSTLRIISRTSVEQYRNTTKTSREIGKELDVNYIVEGSGQRSGDSCLLRVQLIDASTDSHIWTNNYSMDLKETNGFFKRTSNIAQAIASELNATITPKEKELMEKVPTQNAIALNLYLKANNYRRDYDKSRNLSSYQTAISLYQAALETDTLFARAFTGLAFAYWSRYYSETFLKEDFMDSCRILADKALLLDGKLDDAYFIKGMYFREKGKIENALDNFDRALEINPNYSQAYISRGTMLAYLKYDYVRGLENFHKALDLTRGEDRTSMLNYLVNLYMNCGFSDKAKYYLDELLKMKADSALYLHYLCWMEFSRENFEGALKLARREYQIDSTRLEEHLIYAFPPGHLEEAYAHALKRLEYYEKSGRLNVEAYRIGYTFWLAGKYEEAESFYNQHIKDCEELIRLNRQGGQMKFAQYDLACIYSVRGDKAKALQYLNEYSNRNYTRPIELSLTKNDPMFANIRNEERFKDLVRKMETKYQAEHERVRKWLEEQKML
jgi:TolB-like protein/AraC-like DNA-binding protein/Tfp pilus assembly protein PilF